MDGLKIDHIGIAVKEIESTIRVYEALLNRKCSGREQVDAYNVNVAFIEAGDTKIELLQPGLDNSPISKFLAKRGEGIHHIGIKTNDIMEEIKRLKHLGFSFINEEPVRGANNKLVCFLHPGSTKSVLIELCQSRL
jgi:methylmalonyl-CoA/ethylmalonyl-CoA epimerase